MMRRFLGGTLFVLAPIIAAACGDDASNQVEAAAGVDGDAASDDATRRRRAWNEWYTESDPDRDRASGWSRDYRIFMLYAASIERERWSHLLPDPSEDGRRAVTGTTWINIGPTRANFLRNGGITLNKIDSGRIRSIVIDPTNPSRMFVATAGGGVWRSLDGGTTWTPITESLGTLSVGALAMDPSNPNVLYLGLGDPFGGTGVGLVKSIDGGNTWSAPVFLGSATVIADLLVSPQFPTNVFAATNDGLYRSVNSGASFTRMLIGGPGSPVPFVWSLANGANGRVVIALEANPGSGNTDGQIWVWQGNTLTRALGVTKPSGVGRIALGSAPSNRAIIYAMAAIPNYAGTDDLADIFRSTDSGFTFTPRNAPVKTYLNPNPEAVGVRTLLRGQGWYDQAVVVHPTNYDIAFFGGALTMARTADGGNSFLQVSNWLAQFGLAYVHADFHTATYDPNGALWAGTDGGIFKGFAAPNGGMFWSDAFNAGLVTHLVYSVGSSTAARSAVIGGMQDNGTRVRAAGTTFDQLIGGDGFGSHIHQTVGTKMLGSLYFTRIQRSTDGGQTFTSACSGIAECADRTTAPFFTRIEPWTGSPTGDDVYTFSNTKVYKTADYAASWTALGTTGLPGSYTIRQVGVSHGSSNIVGVVLDQGRVFLSSNGGMNWSQSGPLPSNGSSLSFIDFGNADANRIYVASVRASSSFAHLWKSTDFGQTWQRIDGNGLPVGIPVNIVKDEPGSPDILYAGTHLGVYRSTDGGASWVRFGSGMPLVNVTDLYISNDTSLVRAATFGRGFWELIP